MATCNPATLLVSGKDFQALSKRELQICICQLLCNISGGGTSGVTSGNGSPVGIVSAANYTLYVQKDSTPPGVIWWSDGATWH